MTKPRHCIAVLLLVALLFVHAERPSDLDEDDLEPSSQSWNSEESWRSVNGAESQEDPVDDTLEQSAPVDFSTTEGGSEVDDDSSSSSSSSSSAPVAEDIPEEEQEFDSQEGTGEGSEEDFTDPAGVERKVSEAEEDSAGEGSDDDPAVADSTSTHADLGIYVPGKLVGGFGDIREKLQHKLKQNAKDMAEESERVGVLASHVSNNIGKYHEDVHSISNHMKGMYSIAKALHSHYGDLITGKEMARLNKADGDLLEMANKAANDLQKAEDENQPKDDFAIAESYGKL
jgi:hypothetical protein